MGLDASLLNTQHCKVQIKGQVEQSREKGSTLPLHLGVIAIEKGAFRSPLTTVANFTFFFFFFFLLRHTHTHIYIYIYIYIYMHTRVKYILCFVPPINNYGKYPWYSGNVLDCNIIVWTPGVLLSSLSEEYPWERYWPLILWSRG